MTEAEFWTHLEYHASRELGRRPGNHERFLSCDGFVPDDLQPNADCLVGHARISEDNGRTFRDYHFQLWLTPSSGKEYGIDWGILFDSLSSDWLSLDRDKKTIEIRPSSSN
jgi:hypothetical protein